VLAAVGVVLALLILPYFQKWLVQRSEIESARADVVRARQDVTSLQSQRARWNDDDYIKAQARARLNYVMPGETGYVVIPPKEAAKAGSDPGAAAATVPVGDRPWFSDIWLSAQVAGEPSVAK
jgi:hypothetical protein